MSDLNNLSNLGDLSDLVILAIFVTLAILVISAILWYLQVSLQRLHKRLVQFNSIYSGNL